MLRFLVILILTTELSLGKNSAVVDAFCSSPSSSKGLHCDVRSCAGLSASTNQDQVEGERGDHHHHHHIEKLIQKLDSVLDDGDASLLPSQDRNNNLETMLVALQEMKTREQQRKLQKQEAWIKAKEARIQRIRKEKEEAERAAKIQTQLDTDQKDQKSIELEEEAARKRDEQEQYLLVEAERRKQKEAWLEAKDTSIQRTRSEKQPAGDDQSQEEGPVQNEGQKSSSESDDFIRIGVEQQISSLENNDFENVVSVTENDSDNELWWKQQIIDELLDDIGTLLKIQNAKTAKEAMSILERNENKPICDTQSTSSSSLPVTLVGKRNIIFPTTRPLSIEVGNNDSSGDETSANGRCPNPKEVGRKGGEEAEKQPRTDMAPASLSWVGTCAGTDRPDEGTFFATLNRGGNGDTASRPSTDFKDSRVFFANSKVNSSSPRQLDSYANESEDKVDEVKPAFLTEISENTLEREAAPREVSKGSSVFFASVETEGNEGEESVQALSRNGKSNDDLSEMRPTNADALEENALLYSPRNSTDSDIAEIAAKIAKEEGLFKNPKGAESGEASADGALVTVKKEKLSPFQSKEAESGMEQQRQQVIVNMERSLYRVQPEEAKKAWFDVIWNNGDGLPSLVLTLKRNQEGLHTKRIILPAFYEQDLTGADSDNNTIEYKVSRQGLFGGNDLVANSHVGIVSFEETDDGTLMKWNIKFDVNGRKAFWKRVTEIVVGTQCDVLAANLAEPQTIFNERNFPGKAPAEVMDAWVDFVWKQGGDLPLPLKPVNLGGNERAILPIFSREKIDSLDYDKNEIVYHVANPTFVHRHNGVVEFAYDEDKDTTTMKWRVDVLPHKNLNIPVSVATSYALSTLAENLRKYVLDPKLYADVKRKEAVEGAVTWFKGTQASIEQLQNKAFRSLVEEKNNNLAEDLDGVSGEGEVPAEDEANNAIVPLEAAGRPTFSLGPGFDYSNCESIHELHEYENHATNVLMSGTYSLEEFGDDNQELRGTRKVH